MGYRVGQGPHDVPPYHLPEAHDPLQLARPENPPRAGEIRLRIPHGPERHPFVEHMSHPYESEAALSIESLLMPRDVQHQRLGMPERIPELDDRKDRIAVQDLERGERGIPEVSHVLRDDAQHPGLGAGDACDRRHEHPGGYPTRPGDPFVYLRHMANCSRKMALDV